MPEPQPFAILAPVPLVHLESSTEVLATETSVAFGSNSYEVFNKVDELRDGNPVRVLIYASHEGAEAQPSFMVKWRGWYVGQVWNDDGRHPEEKFRPSTALNDTPSWMTFWHVSELEAMDKKHWFPISKVPKFKGGWTKLKRPRGPVLVGLPSALE